MWIFFPSADIIYHINWMTILTSERWFSLLRSKNVFQLFYVATKNKEGFYISLKTGVYVIWVCKAANIKSLQFSVAEGSKGNKLP